MAYQIPDNFEGLIKAGFEAENKDTLYKQIAEEQMAAFREKLDAELKPLVKAITIESLERLRDHMNLADELRVRLTINGEEVSS